MFLLNPFVFSQSGGHALDPAKVKLLLHFDGNFNDSSPNNHAMTGGGNISIDATDTKFGSGKLRFGIDPRDGYLKTPNTFFNFGDSFCFLYIYFSLCIFHYCISHCIFKCCDGSFYFGF